MSRKEFERGSVLERVKEGEVPLVEAAGLLGISYRQMKRLKRRYAEAGQAGLVHGNVGRRSNRAWPAEEREGVLELIRTHYSGGEERGPGQRLGPTLVAEHLLEEHGIEIACSTLRDWMMEAGLWSRVRKHRPKAARRERKRHFGELVQMDGSFHDWYEGRGERAGKRSCMMSMVDDATGRTLLRFGEEETIWAAADILRRWIRCHGVPRALYTDWKNVYKRAPTSQERALGVEADTQFGRMCRKLGIEIIPASSPQAKGRVERSHGTQQDRLIKKMRLRGISDDRAANRYLEEVYLPSHNARYAVAAASNADYHLPLDPSLEEDDVFCLEHRRVVGNDFVVQFDRRGLQLARSARGQVPAGSSVLVRETEDGRLRVIYVRGDGSERVCLWQPAAPRTTRRDVRQSDVSPSHKPNGVQRTRPAADHPWRKAGTLMGAEARARKRVQQPAA